MAVEALSEYGPAAAPAVAVLIDYLADEAREVREAARDALTNTGPPAVERLTEAARGPSASAADQALLALVRIGPEEPLPKNLIEPLIQLMCSARYDDAYGAATLLTRIGAPALPPLMALVREEHIPGSGRAAWAIGEMGAIAKPAIKTLNSIGGSTTDSRLQGMIREAIGKISG
jgi:HEAT repeat protein